MYYSLALTQLGNYRETINPNLASKLAVIFNFSDTEDCGTMASAIYTNLRSVRPAANSLSPRLPAPDVLDEIYDFKSPSAMIKHQRSLNGLPTDLDESVSALSPSWTAP
jgi:hypothetical protein